MMIHVRIFSSSMCACRILTVSRQPLMLTITCEVSSFHLVVKTSISVTYVKCVQLLLNARFITFIVLSSTADEMKIFQFV